MDQDPRDEAPSDVLPALITPVFSVYREIVQLYNNLIRSKFFEAWWGE